MSESEIVDRIFGAVKGYIETRVAAEVETRMATAIAAFTECKELDEETIEERLGARLAADLAEHIKQLPPAKDGEPGLPGKDATPVDEDALNERVAAMVYHVVGKAIKTIPIPKDGEPGEQGEPGRDAAQLEILDGIDVDRKYGRGSYRTFDGGIWLAARHTSALNTGESRDPAAHGWMCVVAGLAGFDVTVDLEAREMTVETRRSGGEIEKQIVYMPILLDRGVYNASKDYQRFDIVSHDGSGWIAQCDSNDVPGTSKSWRLFVMRGRNGKSADRPSIPSADVVRLR